jgi:hypothetical protein
MNKKLFHLHFVLEIIQIQIDNNYQVLFIFGLVIIVIDMLKQHLLLVFIHNFSINIFSLIWVFLLISNINDIVVLTDFMVIY